MKNIVILLAFVIAGKSFAQKKPLDHTVYDNWKSIGERLVSNDGAFVVYTVNPQEGDGELVIQNPQTKYKNVVPRGYNATITEDSKYVIFKVKPFFRDTRQAKIKKKKGDEMPKDSMAILELGTDSIIKKARVKNFKTPENGFGFVAYQLEKQLPDTGKKKSTADSLKIKNNELAKIADSLIRHSIDSIKGNISKEELIEIANKAASQIIKKVKDIADADGDDAAAESSSEGTDLVLRNLSNHKETVFKLVNEFYFDKKGTKLLIETSKKSKDTNSKAFVLVYHLQTMQTDTVLAKFNDAKNFSFDEEGNQLAFVAERDSSEKALTKFYKLWYFTNTQDSAKIIAGKNTVGMQLGYTVSENARVEFSKDGSKLYFGNSPVRQPKDTTLVDFEIAKIDIWNYKDDYLQTQQLKNIDAELKRSYTAVYHVKENKLVQLGADDAETITLVNEGNANWVLGETNKGNRVESQWNGRTKSTAYVINTATGERKTVYKNLYLNANPSPAGKYVYWYNPELKHYFTYEIATGKTRNVTSKLKVPLYEEDNDVPDLPGNYGLMGWEENDHALFVYDQFDAWRISFFDQDSTTKVVTTINSSDQLLITRTGRESKNAFRFINTDKEHRFFIPRKKYLFTVFNKQTKEANLFFLYPSGNREAERITEDSKHFFGRQAVSKNNQLFLFTKEQFSQSPDLYCISLADSNLVPRYDMYGEFVMNQYQQPIQLSSINPQQNDYNWGTAEMFSWKTYTGKPSTGIVYKPEGFDRKKKYPMICYFYEKLSDNLYNYIPPAPTPSRLNISFFVSRGYIVFAPDIAYGTGHPGNDAYNYIVSGARALVKQGFIDSTTIGIQGQSWGGYQVAYLITKTKLFKAAWAGAPVANMTSAYGGIRWESGRNRQFQYEKGQSRIGHSLWDKPQLYIENSPLFHLHKVQTALVIMHNDADGAVPWYQGMELFTGLRRLGKPVWMLNYNGEAHNLVERRNRKDIQIREQQFFDWLLKGEKPAKWLKDGVPATEKGKDWGLEVE